MSRRSVPLRNLFRFTRTAKWLQLSAMPTSSRCLLGMMKMCRRVTPALCAAWPDPVKLKSPDPGLLNSRGAHLAESSSREACPRDLARFDQPCSKGLAVDNGHAHGGRPAPRRSLDGSGRPDTTHRQGRLGSRARAYRCERDFHLTRHVKQAFIDHGQG